MALMPAMGYTVALLAGYALDIFSVSVILPVIYLVIFVFSVLVGIRDEFERIELVKTVRTTERRLAELQIKSQKWFDAARMKDEP
jgi:hypothetical protein